MSAIHVLSHALDDEQRRELIYGGDIVVFTTVAPLVELCAVTDELVRAALGDHDPLQAQFALDRDDYVARIKALGS